MILWNKFKNLKLWLKIIIGILAIIFLPITLLLFALELLIRSVRNRKIVGGIISVIFTIVCLFFSSIYMIGLYEGLTTDPAAELALQQEEEARIQAEKEAEKARLEAEAKAKAEQEAKEKAELEAQMAEQALSTTPIQYNSIDELKQAYNDNLDAITNEEQIQTLDAEKITFDDVISIVESNEELIEQAQSDSEKVDLIEYLVALDDLSHNTTTAVKSSVYEYLVDEYEDNQLKDTDNFYQYLYLSKFLDRAFSLSNDVRKETVSDMSKIVKDNYRGLDVATSETRVNKALGIKSEPSYTDEDNDSNNKDNDSNNKDNDSNNNSYEVSKKSDNSSNSSKGSSNTSKKSNSGSSKGNIVYANGGSSSSNKYHSSPNAHGMKDAIKMTEKEAKASGYIACKRCY